MSFTNPEPNLEKRNDHIVMNLAKEWTQWEQCLFESVSLAFLLFDQGRVRRRCPGDYIEFSRSGKPVRPVGIVILEKELVVLKKTLAFCPIGWAVVILNQASFRLGMIIRPGYQDLISIGQLVSVIENGMVLRRVLDQVSYSILDRPEPPCPVRPSNEKG
jgi:hypothetical protein